MRVIRLALTNFRNHRATILPSDAGTLVLTGPNGAGKTNILEAVSLLAPGRGLRGAALADMVHGTNTGFAIAASVVDGDPSIAPVEIGTGIDMRQPGRRKVRINRAETAASSLSEWLALVWLTPAMDRLFADGASERRRFLDRMTLALTPGHAQHASRYEAAMRSRNRLLTGDQPPDPAWLAALEAQMGEHGAALHAARLDLITALQAELAGQPETLFAVPDIALVDQDGAPAGAMRAEALSEALQAARRSDARAGRTLSGPHRHDLAVSHRVKGQPAARCSTGEQKALLLSLVLSHGDLIAARRGNRPILLLDELAAHLDPLRRAALFERLAASGGQTWMTGTEAALFSDVPGDALAIRVENGAITV